MGRTVLTRRMSTMIYQLGVLYGLYPRNEGGVMFGYTNPDMDMYDDLLDKEYEESNTYEWTLYAVEKIAEDVKDNWFTIAVMNEEPSSISILSRIINWCKFNRVSKDNWKFFVVKRLIQEVDKWNV